MSSRTSRPLPIRIAQALLVLLVCTSLAGCIAISNTPEPKTVLFARNAPDWRPLAKNRTWSGYRKADFDPARYRAVIIEPIVVDANVKREVTGEAQQEVASTLQRELETALKRFTVTDEAGPGVLRLRATITAIGRPNKTINAAGLPVGLLGIPMPIMSSGGAAIEAEVVDAISGERLVALRARARGARGPLGGVRDFDHAKNALRSLASVVNALIVDPRTLRPA